MADEAYIIKVNRRDGSLEIVGSDKEWVAAQLEKLESVLSPTSGNDEHGGDDSAFADAGYGDGSAASGTRRRAKSKGASKSAAKVSSRKSALVEEKLTDEMHAKLEEYVAERKDHFVSKQDQAAIIAGFLRDELGFDGIDASDLSSVYEIMGWRKPVNSRAVINNARERNGYFRGWVSGRARLSVAGENFARFDSKSPKQSKDTTT